MTRPYKVEEFNSILNKLSLVHKGKRRNLASLLIAPVPFQLCLCCWRYAFLRYPGLTFHLKAAHEAITLGTKGRLQCETLILRPTSFHGGVAA